jgi:hypothetical protein
MTPEEWTAAQALALALTQTRPLLDGRELTAYPLIGGIARLSIGPAGEPFTDDQW